MGDEEKRRKVEIGSEKGSIDTSVGSSALDYNDSANSTIVERLEERVKELEALVGGKEEALQVALQGLDSAMGVEVEYRAQLEGCRARVGEFQQAVQHRDQLIEQLSASLEHTLRARDELAQDGERLAQEVSLLRSQLQATSELVTQGSSKSQHDFMLLQNRMLALEDASKKKDISIEELQRQLVELQGVKKDLEQKKTELSHYKSEAAADVQRLMREVERLHQEAANSLSLERQRAQQVAAMEQNHAQQMINLRDEIEEHFGQQLVQIKEKYRLQFSEQLEVLKKHHSEELASVSVGSASSEESVTQQQLQELSQRALQVASEREDLLSQLAFYKEQIQHLSEELLKYTKDDTHESQHNIILILRNENTTLKEEVQALKDKLQSVEDDKTQELELYRQAQSSEVSSWRKRVDLLTLELQNVSEMAQNYLHKLEECTKVHEVELNTLQKAHAQELSFLNGQLEGMQQLQLQMKQMQSIVEEKTSMEKRLQSELQASIHTEEDLRGKLLNIQEEMQVLKVAFEQQKELLQQQASNVEKLKKELNEKESLELVLRQELESLRGDIAAAKETDLKVYKEQIDSLNEQLKQKITLEEKLSIQVLEKEKLQQMWKELEEENKKYKLHLSAVDKQLQDKVKIEKQLKAELQEKVQTGEMVTKELERLKFSLDELKDATKEAQLYKMQVDSLNKQLQERSQSEQKVISDYESRVKTLTSDLNTIESRLCSEIQDLQERAREELLIKQETEKRLEGELEAVRSELLALKASSNVQEYKEQIDELNVFVEEKQKAEGILKAELETVLVEVAALKENQKHLENLNSDLEERLRTEQRLQEELIAAAKMHKEQVDVLSAKISELTSQQNSLDNEAISMRKEISDQKSYIHDLELIREQVSESSKTKEILINDLSVCVRSLTEDNSSYQQKLDHLNKRLDDECHRADENMMLREKYEEEIAKHKQHIEDLENKLKEALQAREEHLKEISIHQQQVDKYKEQLEKISNNMTEEITNLQQEYSKTGDEKDRQVQILSKELFDFKGKILSYQEYVEKLNNIIVEKEKVEAEYKTQVQSLIKEVEDWKLQHSKVTEIKKKQEEEMRLCVQQLEEIHVKFQQMEEDRSKNSAAHSTKVKDLEAEVAIKNELVSKLEKQIEEAAFKFDDLNKLLMEVQQKFAQEKEINAKLLWEKEDADLKFKVEMGKMSEAHCVEMEDHVRTVSSLQTSLQELTVTQERYSKDRDSLNHSSISESELLQLECRLQHALSEKNDIEKSFKDHINKLAESHLREVSVYETQLQETCENLEKLSKTHMNCASEKDALNSEMKKLIIDHEKEKKLFNETIKTADEKLEQLSKIHLNCNSEKEALQNNISEVTKQYEETIAIYKNQLKETLEKMQHISDVHKNCSAEKENIQDHIDKLSDNHEKEIANYLEQLKKANEKVEELSISNVKYLAENGSLKDTITKLTAVAKEVTSYKEQLQVTRDKLEELSKVHRQCISERDSNTQSISEKELAFVEKENALQKKSDALIVCQKELVQTREYIELLKVNLQDEISKVRVELRNLVNICAPNETVNEGEKSGRSNEQLSLFNGKEDCNLDWSQSEGNGSLEQSFICAATIHHDVSSLRGHVEQLVSDLNAVRLKSSKTEELLVVKEEHEMILKKHIEQLEVEAREKENEIQGLKDQLEDLTVKFLSTQSLLAGKEEAEQSLQKEVSEIEVHVCNKCKNLEEEVSHLNATVSEIDEKLQTLVREKETIIKKCNEFEKEHQKLFSEKTDLEKVIEDLRCKIEDSSSTCNSSSNLEETLNNSENTQSSVVSEYSTLKENYRKLLEEKHRVEEILEETKAEVIRLREFQKETLENVIKSRTHKWEREESLIEKGTQEQVSSVKEETSHPIQKEFHANYSDLHSPLEPPDLSLHGVEESEDLDVSAVNAMGDAGSLLQYSRSSSHLRMLKLIQQCADLDSAKRSLSAECEALHSRLEEREAQELLFNEELAAANARCDSLEQRLQDARTREPSHEALLGAKLALECELRALEGENNALKAAKVSLQDELNSLQEETRQLRAGGRSKEKSVEGLAVELASKATEATVLREQLKVAERESQTLRARKEALEKTKEDMLKQFEVFLEEGRHMREQLEEAWQERAEVEEQLGRARCELAVAGLRRESMSNTRESSATHLAEAVDSPVFHLQQEVHTMVEEMAHELVTLRRELQSERAHNEQMTLKNLSGEQLEVQQKLELVLKSNMELLQEKQTLMEQLQKQVNKEQSKDEQHEASSQDLLTQLSVYREQHISLAEAIGTAGILQETLRQQKEELLAKLQEKGGVEELLAVERAELKSSKLKIQLVEQQLQEKEDLYQELFRQKSYLESELKQLEEKLREREQMLQMQRTQLQAELRTQDMRMRRWQLQHRVSEVERRLDSSLKESPSLPEKPLEGEMSAAELQIHLETLRQEMQEAHADAVARLKHHLDAEFTLREQALKAGFNTELANSQAAHKEQLSYLQHALLAAEKEIERLKNAELVRMLGSDVHISADLTTAKERYEKELDSICAGLDEGQAHLFAVLKHLFEEFARQLVTGTTALVQNENEKILEREVAALQAHHQQQLAHLQATLESDHLKTMQALQEVQVVHLTEDNTETTLPKAASVPNMPVQLHAAHSSQVALVQLKHLLYSEYTVAIKEATKGWAMIWKTEVDRQLEDLERALEEEALTLQRLRESPESNGSSAEANTSRPLEELIQEADRLTTRAEELLEKKVKVAQKALCVVNERLDAAFAPVAEHAKHMGLLQHIPKENADNGAQTESDQYRLLAQQLSAEHAAEAGRLRELLAQLEIRRAREMEELRQYFEQKVQELEKHYSEEITSQHSRRHSSSSCDSDSEFTADALLGAGDHALNRIPPLTHICDSCAADPGYKELEERWRGELEKRVEEGRAQLSAAKKEVEAHYEAELSTLRGNYEEKLSRLAQELTCAQQSAVQAAKTNAGRCLQALWRKEVRTVRARLLSVLSCSSENPANGPAQLSPEWNGASLDSLTCEVEPESHGKETLEDLCVELSSQLRQLEATFKQILQQQKEKLLREKEEAQAECAIEEASTYSVQQVISKVQLEEKLRREVRTELEQELEQQVEKVMTMMKSNAEQEQNMFVENQNRIMKEFIDQHRKDLEILKQQHLDELTKAQTASEIVIPTSSLHETTQTDLFPLRRNGTSQTEKAPKKLDAAISPTHYFKKHKEVQTEEPEPLNVSMISQEVQTSPVKGSPFLDASTELLRAVPFEATSLSLLSEPVTIPEPEDDIEDEHGGGFRRVLSDVQTEYMKHVQAILVECMNMLRKMKAGQEINIGEVKFLTEEYVAECCAKFKAVLCSLESMHLSEISKLQEALQRQRSLSRSPYSAQGECNEDPITNDKLTEIIHERDRWQKVGLVLKKLVEDLLTYLSECEDEVNQTLLNADEAEASVVIEVPTTMEESSVAAATPSVALTPQRKRRVHFAPTKLNFRSIISDEQMLLDCVREDEDLSSKLRVELDVCLEHLRSEAAALMETSQLSFPSTPSKGYTVEKEHVETLAQALTAARQRIADLESERRIGLRSEEVAEGFGEQLSSAHQGVSLGLRLQSLSQLQDRARSMLAGGRPSSPQEAQQLQLLDEICREGDRLAEEARREREDLRQQVESADKRLRDTRRFLEEQAAEREQERDEFQQELVRLQEQLKGREKDLADQQRLSREVEALEQQGKEALARHQQLEMNREALQVELKAAVDKVWLLRDVVAELELQVEAKDARATHLESRALELQNALEESENSRQQLSDELESLRAEGGSQLSRQVAVLQEQLEAHRLQAEQCRPAALKQMKAQIRELETNVIKRTQQLEALHLTSSNQSSPSEDVSVREMFRSHSPEDMRAANASPSLSGSLGSSPRSPPPTPLPLRELTHLQERLQRHARAEEAALKWSRDLEMQLKTSRRAEEEASAERDVLQERVSEQLLRIASLEALVDAERWKGTSGDETVEAEELKEQQLLQQRAQDAEEEAERLAAQLADARKEIQQVKEAAARADSIAAEKERNLATRLNCVEHAEASARQRYEALESEADALRQAYEPHSASHLIPLPVLFETLLADKNAEIDELRQRLQVYQVGIPRALSSKPSEITSGSESKLLSETKSITCLCPRTKRVDPSSDESKHFMVSSDTTDDNQSEAFTRNGDSKALENMTTEKAEAGLEELEEEAKGLSPQEMAERYATVARDLLAAGRSAAQELPKLRSAQIMWRQRIQRIHHHREHHHEREAKEEAEAAEAEDELPEAVSALRKMSFLMSLFEKRVADVRRVEVQAGYHHRDDCDESDNLWFMRNAVAELKRRLQMAEGKHGLATAEWSELQEVWIGGAGVAAPEDEAQLAAVQDELQKVRQRIAQLEGALHDCMRMRAETENRRMAQAQLDSAEAKARAASPQDAAQLFTTAAHSARASLCALKEEVARRSMALVEMREEVLRLHHLESLRRREAREEAEELELDEEETRKRMHQTMCELALFEERMTALRQASPTVYRDDGDDSDNMWQMRSAHEQLESRLEPCRDDCYVHRPPPCRECGGMRGRPARRAPSEDVAQWQARLRSTDGLLERLHALRARACKCEEFCKRVMERQTLEAKDAEVSRLRVQSRTAALEAAELAEERDAQRQRARTLEKECAGLKDCVGRLRTSAARVAQLEAEVAAMHEEHLVNMKRLEEADTMEAALLDMVNRLHITEEAAALTEGLQRRVAELEQLLAERPAPPAAAAPPEWEQERDALVRIKCELECAVADQEEQIRRLTETLDRVSRRNSRETPSDVEKMREELETARAEAATLRQEVESLRTEAAEVAELQQMAEQLQTRMDAASTQLERIGEVETGADVDQQMALLTEQVAEERTRADTLEKCLRAAEAQLEEAARTSATREAGTSPVGRALTPPDAEEAARLRRDLEEAQRALQEARLEQEELRRAAEAASAPGIEELAGQVEKELEASAQLDSSLLDHITSVEEDGLASQRVFTGATAKEEHIDNVSKIQQELLQTVDGRTRTTKHTIQFVQPAPTPSLSSPPPTANNLQILELQQQVQQLHEQLHQQLQQMQTAAKVHAQREQELTSSIITEQERVGELQCALRREQRHALDLQSQLTSQAVRAGLAMDEAHLHQASREAALDRSKVHSLEQQLQQERAAVRQLKTALLTERQRFQSAQRRDAGLLEAMRLRLGEVAATACDTLRQPGFQVTPALLQPLPRPPSPAQPQSLPLPVAPMPQIVSSSGPQSLPSQLKDVGLSSEAHAELQHRLSEAEEETKTLRRKFSREQESAQQLRAELSLLRNHNNGLETQLSETRATLAACQAENDRQARQLRALEEAELRQQNRASSERSLAQERARQLETNVIQLEAELAAEHAVREDAVAQAARLHMELEGLRRDAAAASAAGNQRMGQTKSPPGEPLAMHIKDISASLDQQMRDHGKVALTLARLLEERGQLQHKANALTEQVALLKANEAKTQATITRLTAEKASFTEERISLRLELARVKEQLCRRQNETSDAEELENRVNHLFGRYLRAESYRKALAWQKKYLLVALGGYQETEAYTLSRLAHITSVPSRVATQRDAGRARTRFKSAAMVIVAIQRMKYMVRRWYHGRQIGGSTVLNRAYSESLFSGRLSAHGVRATSGSSAPSVSSWSVPISASVGTNPRSPPSHDRCSSWVRTDSNHLPHWRSTEGLTGGISGTPSGSISTRRLAQFVERCDMLQHRLGLATAPTVIFAPPSSSSPSSQRGDS